MLQCNKSVVNDSLAWFGIFQIQPLIQCDCTEWCSFISNLSFLYMRSVILEMQEEPHRSLRNDDQLFFFLLQLKWRRLLQAPPLPLLVKFRGFGDRWEENEEGRQFDGGHVRRRRRRAALIVKKRILINSASVGSVVLFSVSSTPLTLAGLIFHLSCTVKTTLVMLFEIPFVVVIRVPKVPLHYLQRLHLTEFMVPRQG